METLTQKVVLIKKLKKDMNWMGGETYGEIAFMQSR